MDTPTTQNGTGHEPARASSDPLVTRHTFIGFDADGYAHHLDRDTRTVHRIDTDTGTRERTSDLGAWADAKGTLLGNAIERYIHDYIGGEIGWRERPYRTAAELLGGR